LEANSYPDTWTDVSEPFRKAKEQIEALCRQAPRSDDPNWDRILKGLLGTLETLITAQEARRQEGLETPEGTGEESLVGQLHFLQQLLNTIPIPVFYKNDRGLYLGCNQAFEKFIGLPRKQLIGKSVHQVFPPELAEIYYQADSKLFDQPGIQTYETLLLHADGTKHDIIFSKATYVGTNGRTSGLIGAILDITERKRMERQVRSLGHQLLKIQEDEKRNLSRELHDVIGQNLLTLKMGLDNLHKLLASKMPEVVPKLSEFLSLIKQTLDDVRDMAQTLRPSSLEQLGLVKAGLQYCEDFSAKHNIQVDFSAFGIRESLFDNDTKITLYRLIQEGLNNIKKHSGASQVTIRLVSSFPDVILRIEDNGRGFDFKNSLDLAVQEKHLGLISMTERVSLLQGKLEIKSKLGMGTKIVIEFPSREDAAHVQKAKDTYR